DREIPREDQIALVAESIKEPECLFPRAPQLLAKERAQSGAEHEVASAIALVDHDARREEDHARAALPDHAIDVEAHQSDQPARARAPESDLRQRAQLVLVGRAVRLDVA